MFEIKHLDFLGNEEFDELLEKMFPGLRMKRFSKDGVPGVRVYVPPKGDSSISKNRDIRPEPAWRKEVRSEVVEKPVDFPNEDEAPSPDKRVCLGTDNPRDFPPPSMPKNAFNEKSQPKSILEMFEDGDERLEKLLGKIIDKKLDERNLTTVDSDEDEDDFEENDFEEDDEDEEETQKKDPFVFIANRLTFLVQTLQPIVFDTSSIETKGNSITIALDVKKTFPRIASYDDLGYITYKINSSPTIMNEIDQFIEDTEIRNICCFPVRVPNREGSIVWGIKFVVYSNN